MTPELKKRIDELLVCAEHERLDENVRIFTLMPEVIQDLTKYTKQLEKKLGIAIKALKEYAKDAHFYSDGTQMSKSAFRDMDDYGGLSRRALEEIGGEG